MNKALRNIIIVIILTIFFPTLILANFIGMNWGSRSLALGNAYVALSNDPSAIFWNPAGLAKIDKYTILISHQNLWNVKNLYNEMVSISLPFPGFHTGLGWTQMNLLNEYIEQMINISLAKVIWIKKIACRFGISINNYSAIVDDYENISKPFTDFLGLKVPGKFDLNVGMIIDPIRDLSLGFVVRNMFERTFQFTSEGDKIERNFALGFHYLWRKSVNFVGDYNWRKDEEKWHFGGEIWFFDVFAPRIGMNGDNLTVGFGIKTKNWKLDGAVLAHQELGSTYRLSFCLQFK